ncbi:E3 ubiquitin-protein ligase PUB23-like isoform X2 [Telopea speciosissima]|uniref:E3 ubiquitin-protein ligase PUB23-like isoform X2 n=1 Tax=Telopea speciosissima TaxID=54955 RepID=UPI001CC5DE05|nr:E3 ubiquitin-protein ligase PUB23-like isoform X2 [Telopea speciosissima]
MEEVDVPSYFLCPISMEIMRDPVTVSSGITYDRDFIERWIFSSKNNTCPVTRQPLLLSETDLMTPNHTLRRLIQAWCTLNASKGIQRIPTPKPPVDNAQIVKLLNEGKTLQHQMRCLRSLRSIANESERNRKCLESAGAVEFLASIVANDEGTSGGASTAEALYILHRLHISEVGLKKLLISRNGDFIERLMMRVLQHGSYTSRAYATLLLKSMFELSDPTYLMSLRVEHFVQIVNVLRDQISQQASKASLQILVELCQWSRNRIKAVEAGAVSVLTEILLETTEKRDSEMVLVVLDQLCGCAEGRAELLRHRAGIAVVSKKILRVSHVATDRGVRILSSVSRFSATSSVLQEMLQVGVVSKLCLVLQVDCRFKTKEKIKEMLRLHSRVWKNSSCIPLHLLSSYPSHS